MQIYMTVPITANGVTLCEFEAAVDITVTSYGCPAQTYGPAENCYPAEGPEWEAGATYVDAGERDKEGKPVSKLIECPDELLIFVTRHTEGEEFIDRVCSAIAEDDSFSYYDPKE